MSWVLGREDWGIGLLKAFALRLRMVRRIQLVSNFVAQQNFKSPKIAIEAHGVAEDMHPF